MNLMLPVFRRRYCSPPMQTVSHYRNPVEQVAMCSRLHRASPARGRSHQLSMNRSTYSPGYKGVSIHRTRSIQTENRRDCLPHWEIRNGVFVNPVPGPGAHAIIKSLTRSGFKIINILDTTRFPRGGPKKKGGRRGRRP